MATTDIKIIWCGNSFEIYRYEKPISYGHKKPEKPTDFELIETVDENGEIKNEFMNIDVAQVDTPFDDSPIKDPLEKKRWSRTRTRNTIRRLALANFSNNSKFITLTFEDTNQLDIKNPKETNIYFKKFIQRLRRRFGDFKYLSVIEFQDKNGRGAVHYHMMANLPYIPHDLLQMVWENRTLRSHKNSKFLCVGDKKGCGGFIRINNIKDCDNVGAYISAYINKDVEDTRLDGLPVYLSSENMIRPMEYRGKDADALLHKLFEGFEINGKLHKIEENKKVFTNSYISEHTGKISYEEYNLFPNKKQREKIDKKRQEKLIVQNY